MMYCEVVLVSDLSRPIEQNNYEILDMTLEEFLYSEIKMIMLINFSIKK